MEGRLIGYARVSTSGQKLNLQLDALKHAAIPDKLIFIDKAADRNPNAQALPPA